MAADVWDAADDSDPARPRPAPGGAPPPPPARRGRPPPEAGPAAGAAAPAAGAAEGLPTVEAEGKWLRETFAAAMVGVPAGPPGEGA